MTARKKSVTLVAGARPNFIKVAPILRALRQSGRFRTRLVHTGQHFDARMSGTFFRELGIPEPDASLGIGGGTHAEQTGRILIAFERDLVEHPADLVVVVGDVNSTLAAALAACKLGIPTAHVEAGLRSFDRSMPEEHNRVVADAVADYWFVSEPSGLENLRREGKPRSRTFFVGNVMIDSLRHEMKRIDRSPVVSDLELHRRGYAVVTLHRPSNVDSVEALRAAGRLLEGLGRRLPTVFPVHPRTRARAEAMGVWRQWERLPGLRLTDPMGYRDFIKLVKESRFVVTDSGGIQEETTVLGVPCLTLRDNTERPVTVLRGTGELVGRNPEKIWPYVDRILKGRWKRGRIPRYWDGRAAERIVRTLMRL